jgi:ABC-2 type transport system permease protein
MKTIFGLTLKAAFRDPYLLFWSILLPAGGMVGLGLFIGAPSYPTRILTGMMAASILFYALVTSAFSVLTQRRRGVYNLLHVTAMPLWQYVTAVSGAWTLVSGICAAMLLLVGSLVLKVAVPLSALFALVPILLFAAIGYVLSSFIVASISKTEGHVSMICNIVMLPLMFLSDAFYSLDAAPGWLLGISRANPFQWFVSGLREALSGDTLNWLIHAGLLLLILIAALLLAVRTFRYKDA